MFKMSGTQLVELTMIAIEHPCADLHYKSVVYSPPTLRFVLLLAIGDTNASVSCSYVGAIVAEDAGVFACTSSTGTSADGISSSGNIDT